MGNPGVFFGTCASLWGLVSISLQLCLPPQPVSNVPPQGKESFPSFRKTQKEKFFQDIPLQEGFFKNNPPGNLNPPRLMGVFFFHIFGVWLLTEFAVSAVNTSQKSSHPRGFSFSPVCQEDSAGSQGPLLKQGKISSAHRKIRKSIPIPAFIPKNDIFWQPNHRN